MKIGRAIYAIAQANIPHNIVAYRISRSYAFPIGRRIDHIPKPLSLNRDSIRSDKDNNQINLLLL